MQPSEPPPEPTPTADAAEQAWKTLGLVNDWTRFLDGKAVAILLADGGIAGGFSNLIKGDTDFLATHHWFLFFIVVLFFCLGCSVFKALYCVTPTLYPGKAPLPTMFNVLGKPSLVNVPEDKKSVTFFEHIASKHNGAQGYGDAALPIFSDNLRTYQEIAAQIHANAKIAHQKSEDVGRAVQFLVLTLCCGLLTGLVRLIFIIL